MKLRLCLLLLLVVLLVTDLAEGKRPQGPEEAEEEGHNYNNNYHYGTPAELEDSEEDEMDLLMEDEAAEEEAEAELEDAEEAEVVNPDLVRAHDIMMRHKLDEDPCLKKRCGPGRECTLTDEAEPVCTCVTRCSHESDARRQVCSNYNDTWNSDCSIYRQRCECVDGLEGCIDPKNEHLHIEFYGQCRQIGECPEEEMSDFPRRMREWIFNVMKDMAERQQLGPLYKEMEQEAEQDEQKRWINSAVWRWCELDSHPVDSSVSRHELFPIRATLLAMEHCIAPFLNGCDVNDDHDISLKEWATCLNVTSGEIKERCERIKPDSL